MFGPSFCVRVWVFLQPRPGFKAELHWDSLCLISCNPIAVGKTICGGHRAAETLVALQQQDSQVCGQRFSLGFGVEDCLPWLCSFVSFSLALFAFPGSAEASWRGSIRFHRSPVWVLSSNRTNGLLRLKAEISLQRNVACHWSYFGNAYPLMIEITERECGPVAFWHFFPTSKFDHAPLVSTARNRYLNKWHVSSACILRQGEATQTPCLKASAAMVRRAESVCQPTAL